LRTKENAYFKTYDISPQQYNILRILRGANKAIKVQTVKERMIERSPNATRLMDKLCDKKLIERTRCEHDRRVVYIQISKQGLQLLEDIDVRADIHFMDNLNDQEAKLLSDLLDKIR
jgi:DNA-binding MarR family transcriptional regulator